MCPNPTDHHGTSKQICQRGWWCHPTATDAKCEAAELDALFKCHNASAVGVVRFAIGLDGKTPVEGPTALYDMVAPPGVPAEFGFAIPLTGVVVHLLGRVRTGGDYGLSADSFDILGRANLLKVGVTLWGDPTAASHDGERGLCAEEGGSCPVERLERPMLTLPSACTGESLVTGIRVDSWQEIGSFLEAQAGSPAVTGCEDVPFAPSLAVQPDSHVAGEPSGLSVDLRVPQQEGLTNLATSDLKEASVTLSAGLSVSPSAANGLATCSEAEVELNGPGEASCS